MKRQFILCSSLIAFTLASFDSVSADMGYSTEIMENRPIRNIEITMENLPPGTSFDAKAILSRLKTKTGDPFSQNIFDEDLKTLSEEYDRVEPTTQVTNGEVYVHLKIWPRPQIRQIKWEGNTEFKTKKLQKELGIRAGAQFNRETFTKALGKVKELYIKKGYFESEIESQVQYDTKTNEVDIVVQIKEGRSGKVDDIDFEGFSKDEISGLLEMIHTKRYNLFTSWFTGDGIFNEDAIDDDKLTITNFLQNKGFADAKVTIETVSSPKEGRIILKVTAQKGVIYKFDKISFTGNTIFTDDQVKAIFSVHKGDLYSPEALRNTMQSITDLYGRKGHIEANVQYETELVEDKPLYNVHFDIDEGFQYRVGLIRIFGNINTIDKVILRECNLVPGEIFDMAKLKATQQRLENMGYFKTVNVYSVRTSDDESLGDNYRDVYIEVTEGMTGNVSLFFGFSTSEDVFAGLDLAETNFNFKGIPRIFKDGLSAVRGGGEYVHARANFGAKQRTYSLSWMNPYLNDSLWRLGFDISKSKSHLVNNNYSTDTYGLSVYTSYPLSNYWTYGNKYRVRYEKEHYDKQLVERNNAAIKAQVAAGETPNQEALTSNQSGVVSGLGASLTYDSTFTMGKPRRGLRSYNELEYVGVGGAYTFAKLALSNTYYSSLWSRGIMKYRYDFKFIEPFTRSGARMEAAVPLAERFFLGGDTTVRGYDAYSLGPTIAGSNNKDPMGGISSSLVSVEYLQEIFSFLDAFVFIDGGFVGFNPYKIGQYNMSYGGGIRLEMLNRIPIILGLGYPVNEDRDQKSHFFFSMGGQF